MVSGLANAMLDTVLYQLEEALKRIREVNMAEWGSESGTLEHNQGYIRHLLDGSSSTLQLLTTLTSDVALARLFGTRPIANRSASVALKFTDMLCGPRAVELKVPN